MTTAWVLAATLGGWCVVLVVALNHGASWWVILIATGISLVAGAISGLIFAEKERDFVLPTPLTAGLVAFTVAAVMPFLVGFIYALVRTMTSHTVD